MSFVSIFSSMSKMIILNAVCNPLSDDCIPNTFETPHSTLYYLRSIAFHLRTIRIDGFEDKNPRIQSVECPHAWVSIIRLSQKVHEFLRLFWLIIPLINDSNMNKSKDQTLSRNQVTGMLGGQNVSGLAGR